MTSTFITHPNSIVLKFSIGQVISCNSFDGEVEEVIYITLGLVFWTFIVNFRVN